MKKYLLILLTLLTFSSLALHFNETKIITLKDKVKELREDEGYVYLSLDTNTSFVYLEFKPTLPGKKMKFFEIKNGRNYAFVKLKEGNYYLSAVKYSRFKKINNKYLNIGTYIQQYDKSMYKFRVKKGVINYPGNWKTRASYHGYGRSKLKIRQENDSLIAMLKLQESFSDEMKKFNFIYNGKVKDGFPNFFNSKQTRYIMRVEDESFDKIKAEEYSISQGVENELEAYPNIWKYLKGDNSLVGNFSPNGKYLLYHTSDESRQRIIVFNTRTYDSFAIFDHKANYNYHLTNIKWIDDDSVFYTYESGRKEYNYVIHMTIKGNEITSAKQLGLYAEGHLISPLINEDNKILVLKAPSDLDKRKGLYKIDTSDKNTIKKSFKKKHLKIRKYKNIIYWMADKNGDLRFAINYKAGKKDEAGVLNFLFLKDINTKDWHEIKSISTDDDWLFPEKISEDGSYFYVITDAFSDKNQVHKYSTSNFSHIGTFFADDNINVEGLIINTEDEITGMLHVKNGFYKIDYFNQEDDGLIDLRKNNPKLQLYLVQKNLESNLMLIYGDNEYSKGAWFIHNSSTKKTVKVVEQDIEYKKLEKGLIHKLNITTDDGLYIEGFLSMPTIDSTTKFPLVVMPHGGPIGIRDFAYNDSVQHFFASHGVATLKVNYRGSGGKGKQFQKLGHGEWGNKIESDINQMVQYSIDNYNISNSEVCSMGSSYGGYSAIMLTILYPNRYKCAVSLAGVTDLSLLFTSNQNIINSDEIYDQFVSMIGDPKLEMDMLQKKSPVYLVDKISKPILFIHGVDDETVTIEHSHRLKAVMDSQNKPNEMIILNDEGHSLDYKNSYIIYVVSDRQ